MMLIKSYEVKYGDGSATIPALEFETDAQGRMEVQNCAAQHPHLTPYTLTAESNDKYDDEIHADLERDDPGYVDSEVWILTPGYRLVNRMNYVLIDLEELENHLMFEEFLCLDKSENGKPLPQFELTD